MFVELERFSDAQSAVFEGFPTTRVAARHRWAHAFRVYFAELADMIGAAPIAPPQSTIQATFADDVELAFFEQLRLDDGMSARMAAEDFADAWRSGLRTIRAGSGGTVPSSSTVYAFAAWTPTSPPRDLLDDRRDVLADELTLLFSTPSMSAPTRLAEIAEAFHHATFELEAQSDVPGTTIVYR
jgi:hypothetical protein